MRRRSVLALLPVFRAYGRTPSFDHVLEHARTTTKHGGLLVQIDGRLVYERYFGAAHRDATPNLASVGKSFTSLAVGILMHEKKALFKRGLETKVFDTSLLPPTAFPPNDDRKRDILLGQLLCMTSGIRGNSPGFVRGKPVEINPPGLDGWQAMRDKAAIESDLWCPPGAGYSYATAGVHLASMIVRHVTGAELQAYLGEKIAKPLRWGKWGYGYRRPEIDHTPGGGGIEVRGPDMIRFGQMLLRGGEGIVPREYIALCSKPSLYNPHFPYSLQFDVNADGHVPGVPRDAYWKTGSGGHCLYIVPSMKLVVWKLGGRDEQYGVPGTGPFNGVADNHRTIQLSVDAINAG